MKTEKKLHAIATNDAVVLAVSTAFEQAQTALANLSAAASAADEAKRVLNDRDFWSNYEKRNSAEEFQLHRQTFLTLQYSANLALPSHLDAAKSAASLLQAAAKKLRGHQLPDQQRDALVDWYHTAQELARHIFSEVTRLKARLSDSADEAKEAFDATFEHISDETTFGWPRVHFLTPWIDVDSVICYAAAGSLRSAKTLLEDAGRALRNVKDFRGNLDEESYGRRLERAKSNKQREQLIADQHSRRLQLNHLRVGVDLAWSQNSDVCSELVNWVKALVGAAKTDATNEQALRNNTLVLVRAIVECVDMRGWINNETNEHRDLYLMVRDVAEEAFTGETA